MILTSYQCEALRFYYENGSPDYDDNFVCFRLRTDEGVIIWDEDNTPEEELKLLDLGFIIKRVLDAIEGERPDMADWCEDKAQELGDMGKLED